MESLYGHPGFSNLRKADPWRVFLDSPSGHQGLSNLQKADPWGVLWSLYQAIRDLEIYKKQILEGNLESPSGHQGFSNFKKSGPRRLFCLESPSSPVSWVSIAWILVPCRF